MKKTLIKSFAIIFGFTAVTSLSSCLKDKNYVDFSKVGTLVELPLSAYKGLGALAPEALPITATAQAIPVVVNIASPSPLTTAVSVTVALDQAALDAYNTKNSTTFVLPPAGSFSIANPTVTVPANQRTATVNVMVTTSLLNPAGKYVIPVSIISASGQKISNYKTVLLNVQAKNAYDGVYEFHGYITRQGDPVLSGNIKAGVTASLATTGAASVTYAQVWSTGGAVAGIDGLTLTVDPSTNKVTPSATTNATLTNYPGYNSRYDPATKTFYVAFYWNSSDITFRNATDTLIYKGVRP